MKYVKNLNTTCDLTEQMAAQKAMWAIVLELFRHIGLTTVFWKEGNFSYIAKSLHRAFSNTPEFFEKAATNNDMFFKDFESVMEGASDFVEAFNSSFTKDEQRTLYLNVLALLTLLNFERREALLDFLHVFSVGPNNTLFACNPNNAEFLFHLLTNPELITERSVEHD